MKTQKWLLWTLCLCLLPLFGAMAEEKESQDLGEVVVTGERLLTPTKQTNETVYTGTEITRKGIETQGEDASISVYEAIGILPGITVESSDPYGLAAEQRFIRTRGVRGYLGSMTVEGVPNWGGNPIGPRDYLYDTENFESIAVYKGAVPADLGTGVGARGGAIELRPRWPEQTFGADFSQGFGADHYTRSFLRLDSGALPATGTGLSLSYSRTAADKWKGPGDLGPRNNVNFMVLQPVEGQDGIKIWVNHNDQEQDLYRPLTYAETRDLSANYEKDYNRQLTGDRTQDINYYDYNRSDLDNTDFLSVIPWRFSDLFSLSFKPFYSSENSEIYNGVTSQNGMVQKRDRDITRTGLISEVHTDFSAVKASLGYGYEASDMQINTLNYTPGSLEFIGYGVYMANQDDGVSHTPYLRFSGAIDRFDWQAGVKYFDYTDPALKGYVTDKATKTLVAAPDLDREEKEYDEVLPSVGVGWRVTDAFDIHANYGRTNIRPYSYVPIINTYSQNRAAFQNAGVTLDELFDGYDMEISDNYELGSRLRAGIVEVMPTAFYAKHKHLLTTVYDPRVNLSYQQNIGNASSWGGELGTSLYLHKNVTFFVNPSYTRLTYDEDLTFQGKTLDTEGNQVVDTPEWVCKTGFIFNWHDIEIAPSLRYLDRRYGDAENTERVDDYIVADLRLGYTKKNLPFTKALKVALDLTNLFDEEYVAVVNASDDSRAGTTSYSVGAPFNALLSVGFEF